MIYEPEYADDPSSSDIAIYIVRGVRQYFSTCIALSPLANIVASLLLLEDIAQPVS